MIMRDLEVCYLDCSLVFVIKGGRFPKELWYCVSGGV